MANEARVSAERLRELLVYDPDRGTLHWLVRDRSEFPSVRAQKIWNVRFAGKPAFSTKRKNGYLVGGVDNVTCSAHRVCWAVHTGSWPSGEIDHINGDRTDNRITNLRDVSRAENTKNKQIGIRNNSGALGVMLDHTGKYRARITLDYKTVELGRYSTFEEALAVRKEAEARFAYHPNHGRPKALEAA